MVGLENFELAGIKSYTRFWGLLMFGSYSVINVIVLLNLLIAMMSNSYAIIDAQKEKDDVRYTSVMRALVWRYVSAMHRKMDDDPVTEDDINELKGDVSALRYELLEVFERNGMDVSFTDRKEKTVLAKRMKIWERRLMKDFHVAPVSTLEDDGKPVHEDSLARFRRIARMAAAAAKGSKWDQTLAATGISSQIGRCRSRQSFKNQQNLQRAIDEARRLVLRAPIPESRPTTPVDMPESHSQSILELIKDISSEIKDNNYSSASMPRTPVNVRAEPSPLKANRVAGNSPPKVMKKKAPAPLPGDGNPPTDMSPKHSNRTPVKMPRSRSRSPSTDAVRESVWNDTVPV
ncbi:jg27831 [Pararge aegeria aegeria]|uniref:Jg27831 protein n=1 Tax=Pararge aegeria aegeria TaxID=348720 RepID=A0A8S4RFL5_9NEOP|nr:jg27831 [Pararge aegeria aegeria]